ncbi:MAG: Fe-S cluster assembly protein SufD [Nevskia sp.]|nr:Fe-S cluster assembly protein SufD [Nevskia sp.]
MKLQPYSEAFERFAATLSDSERSTRGRQLQRFLTLGFPSKREEDWRYTDLSPLADKTFGLANEFGARADLKTIDGTERLVFVDGRFDPTHSSAAQFHGELPTIETPAADGLLALNAAFAASGLNLQLAANEHLDAPLHVLFLGSGDAAATMSHQRHRIVLGAGASATVILEFARDSGGERLATHTLDIELGANAQLRLHRLQFERAGANLLTRIDARLARDARLKALCLDAGGGFTRHDFNVSLDGAGADAEVHGLYAPQPRAHVDNHTRIVHAAPHGRSREHFRGIVGERTRAVFSGKVVVQPGAQKTDSEQRIANLLLSKHAEVNAKPDLEIYADDVKCAHGATVGQLDDSALAYLRSRGIDAATAKSLLLRAFAIEILDHVGYAPLRRHIEDILNFPDDPELDALIEAVS